MAAGTAARGSPTTSLRLPQLRREALARDQPKHHVLFVVLALLATASEIATTRALRDTPRKTRPTQPSPRSKCGGDVSNATLDAASYFAPGDSFLTIGPVRPISQQRPTALA